MVQMIVNAGLICLTVHCTNMFLMYVCREWRHSWKRGIQTLPTSKELGCCLMGRKSGLVASSCPP